MNSSTIQRIRGCRNFYQRFYNTEWKKEICHVNAFSRCAVRKILHDMFPFYFKLYFATTVPFDQMVGNDDLGCGEIWIFYVVDDLGGSFTSKLTGSDVN